MKIEQKLDYFAAVLLDEAEREKKRAAKSEAAHRAKLIKAAEKQAQGESNAQLRAYTQKVRAAHYKIIAEHTRSKREALFYKRQAVMSEVFDGVAARLNEYSASEAYIKSLEHALTEKAGEGEYTFVQLLPRDIERVNVPDSLHAEICEDNIVGGYILYDSKRKIRVDCSFLAKLKASVFNFEN